MLTPAQLATLKTAILAGGAAQMFIGGDLTGVADFYNALASPDYFVWRRSMARNDVVEGTSLDADGTTARQFDWASPGGFIARSQGERDAFREIWNHDGNVNPSFANVRAAWDDIFSGTGAGAQANRAHFKNVARRKASVMEKLFATGTGSAASPAIMGAEGPLDYQSLINL